jgi:divalent metal cation (Fe/Co/Zn/Cd) transporter
MRPGPASPASDWLRHAKVLALITIAYNLAEGLASMAFGWSDDSMALFGFGADSFIEVFSAGLILWRLRAGVAPGESMSRERKATKGIGTSFLLLAAGVAGAALLQLAGRRHPETTVPGLVVSLLSLGAMGFLWREKKAAAKALDSRALASDAACSLACLQLSAVLLAGSLLYLLSPRLWWMDSAAAIALAALIAKEGWEMRRAAASPSFDGGCGCH